MASRGNRGGAGERVLESKHVIGLFMLMLVFSGVFFALGYVMGHNQYDGQVRAASNPRATPDPVLTPQSEFVPKRSSSAAKPSPATTQEPPSDVNSQPNSDWGFYNAGKSAPDDTLKPTSSGAQPSATNAVSSSKTPSRTANVSAKTPNTQQTPAAGYTVQVAALRREVDAHSVALTLQKKKFPAFVSAPQSDKYFHVQVGPYPDQKSAEAAKKGLESAGFKAIVKH